MKTMKQIRCKLDELEANVSSNAYSVGDETMRRTLEELVSTVQAFMTIYELEHAKREDKIAPPQEESTGWLPNK